MPAPRRLALERIADFATICRRDHRMSPGVRPMKGFPTSRLLLVVAVTAATFAAVWPASAWLLASVRTRLATGYQQSLAELSDQEAARLVRRLAHGDAQWLEVLVQASGDERPDVAKAAATALQGLVARWRTMPPEGTAAGMAKLARLLAQHAPTLPPQRRHLPFLLTQQLIEFPVDGRLIDAAQFIDDCQTVLLLPRSDEPEIRLAAVPESAAIDPPSQPTSGSGRMSLSDK